MRSFCWLFTFFFPFALFANWMCAQIQEDLLPFQQGIHKSELFQEMQKSYAKENGLVLITLKEGRIEWVTDPKYHQHERLLAVVSFLERLSARNKLPDVTFLITLADSYEESGPFAIQMGDVPVFTFAKRQGAKSILFPDFEALRNPEELIQNCKTFGEAHPWKSKVAKVFWRGASTGGVLTEENYDTIDRVKLVRLAERESWLDAGLTILCQATEGAIAHLKKYAKEPVPIKDHFRYKYLIDVDGNSCTYSRCRWILLSNSVLIKQASQNIQWYYKALKPYEHYVPCKSDFTDLSAVYTWLKAHDKEAHEIAKKGKLLGREIFSIQAIDTYVIKLLQEYAILYVAQ